MSSKPRSGQELPDYSDGPPVEIRTAAALLFGAGVLFVLVAALRIPIEGGSAEGLLLVPLLQLAVAVGVAGGLLRAFRFARLGGVVFALLFALLHVSILLQPFALWIRITAGLIAAAHVYAAVLLNTRPSVLFTNGGVRRP